VSRRRALALAAAASAVVVADQVTKAIARAELTQGASVPVIDGVLWLTRVQNTGAAFGMFPGGRWLFVATALVVLGAVTWVVLRERPRGRLAWVALALVTGGTIGNLIDRVLAGGVTDFLDLGWWPVFNVADIALDTGVALIAGWLLFGNEHRTSDAAEPDGDPRREEPGLLPGARASGGEREIESGAESAR
jgi:signal peptidase II